jgi:hypothetical protein
MNSQPHDDLYQLLDALCEDRIDDAGVARLQQFVMADAEARRLYVEYLSLHGLLYWDAVEGTGVQAAADVLPDAAAVSVRPVATAHAPARKRLRGSPRLIPLAVAAAVLVATMIALNRGNRPGIVQQETDGTNQSGRPIANSTTGTPEDDGPLPSPLKLPGDGTPSNVADTTNSAQNSPVERPSRRAIVEFVNSKLAEAWTDSGVEPSLVADDSEWLRRAYLDIAGRIPTVNEVQGFLADKSADKRSKLVDHLLDDPTYAEHLATVWTNLLVGRAPERSIDRDALSRFLREQFWDNKPWTETVTELVAAEGSEHENGASNFLLAHLNNQAVPATAITARIFLCEQVQCSQCHIHPIVKDWGQEQFWELNAFFNQTAIVESAKSGPDGKRQVERTLVSKAVGEETFYETLGGVMRVAYPKFDGKEIDTGAATNRRRELARLMSEGDRPQMAAAFVNRMWTQFFGRGFTTPVDDMGPHNPPSHPEILDALTEEFVKSGYDVKQLVRWLCETRLYQLSSKGTAENVADSAEEGNAPLFSRMYVKPLTAEQLFDSLIASTRADQSGVETWSDAAARRKEWLAQFYTALQNEENSDSTTFDGSLPQALVMMNGELVREATSGRPGTFLSEVLSSRGADVEKLRRLSLSTLSREPTPAEIAAFKQIVRQSARSDRAAGPQVAMNEGLSDAYWAFLNSAEFLVNH